MWSITFLFGLFAIGVSAGTIGIIAPPDDGTSAAVAVRPDWTDKPQGERVLPRLDVKDNVTFPSVFSMAIVYFADSHQDLWMARSAKRSSMGRIYCALERYSANSKCLRSLRAKTAT